MSRKQGKYDPKNKKGLEKGENVKYVKCVGRPPTKVLKTGEMLNMLNVLNVQVKIQPKWPKHVTYLTFPCFNHVRKKH